MSRSRLLIFCLLGVFAARLALAAGKANPSPPPITSLAGLSKALLDNSPPSSFQVEGQITCLVPHGDRFIYITLADGTNATFLAGEFTDGRFPFQRGDLIRASGTTTRMPDARVERVKVLRSAPPPPPASVPPHELWSSEHRWQFVRIAGIVRDVRPSETDSRWAFLLVATGDELVYVSLPVKRPHREDTPLSVLRHLIGRRATVDGFPNPRDRSPRHYLPGTFHCGGCEDVRPDASEPKDPFAAPDIATLDRLPPERIASSGFVRTEGYIVTVWSDRNALIRDRRGKIVQLVFDGTSLPSRGARVEAVGIPHTDLFNLTLTLARWRPSAFSGTPPPPSRPVDLPRLKSATDSNFIWNLHGRDVRIVGRVHAALADEQQRSALLIDIGSQLVTVEIPPGVDRTDIGVGSTVEVVGTYIRKSELWRPDLVFPRFLDFSIVVNGPDGIRILSRPPWWTPRRFAVLIATLVGFLIAVLVWNLSLRRLAARKGRILFREQLGRVTADLRTEERTRLAVELHDTLAQNLTGVSMEIEAANELRGNAPQPMLQHLDIAMKALKSCRDELRNCLWDLRSQALEETDMTRAILRTLQPSIADSRLNVRFNVPRVRLSDKTTHALLRIIRELAVNAVRHGAASSVRIAGSIDGDRLLCSVTDDGGGFDPDRAPGILQGHFGLQGVRERIDELGGEFTIASSPGKGTRALVTVPIPHGRGGTADGGTVV